MFDKFFVKNKGLFYEDYSLEITLEILYLPGCLKERETLRMKPNSKEFYQWFFRFQDCTKHFLRFVDRKTLIDKENNLQSALNAIYLTGQSFSYFCCETKPSPEYNIFKDGDLFVGIYFPHHQIGDTFELTIGHNRSTLVVTDPNKVYLPLEDKYILPLQSLFFVSFSLRQTKGKARDVYFVKAMLNLPIMRALTESMLVFSLREKYYCTGEGFCSTRMKPWKQKPVEVEACLFVEHSHYAIKIQKAWREYLRRKRRKQICSEVRALPDLGIDYLDALKRFNKATEKQ